MFLNIDKYIIFMFSVYHTLKMNKNSIKYHSSLGLFLCNFEHYRILQNVHHFAKIFRFDHYFDRLVISVHCRHSYISVFVLFLRSIASFFFHRHFHVSIVPPDCHRVQYEIPFTTISQDLKGFPLQFPINPASPWNFKLHYQPANLSTRQF